MEPILNPNAPPSPAADALIKDSSEASFVQDVIETSENVPVIVDFWAPWCGPCKQLGPLLEKIVTEANGAVKMVKIDIDQNQNLAQQLRIQSIPAVYAFHHGKPVDAFQGALPESQLREFVEKLAKNSGAQEKSPIEEALDQANALMETEQFDQASTVYSQIIEHAPDSLAAKAGLARCRIETGDLESTRELVDALSDEERNDEVFVSILSALELADKAATVGDRKLLQTAIELNPKDHETRYKLALALYANGEVEESIEALLEIIRQNRTWNEDAARIELLKFFEVLGPTNPATVEGRRKLSTILFS
ncbi:MAG: thioredoxin [Legionellales bacterium]|nr:thioredoxin [Legionellales bacterium]